MKLSKEAWEKRISDIVEASKTSSTYTEISEKTGLAHVQIERAFREDAESEKLVQQNLKRNKEEKKQAKKEAAKIAKRTGRAKAKQATETAKNDGASQKEENTSKAKKENLNGKKIVLDSSLAWLENLDAVLQEYAGCIKAVTTITIEELEQMASVGDTISDNANQLLELAATNEHFESVWLEKEKKGSLKRSFLTYCEQNKKDILLLTANAGLAAKARALGIKFHFLANKMEKSELIKRAKECTKQNIKTLMGRKKVGNKLFLYDFGLDSNANNKVLVRKKDKVQTRGICELTVGDEIFILVQKEAYFTFTYFRMISLQKEENVSLLFGGRFYYDEKVSEDYLPEECRNVFKVMLDY